jgi:bacterioferritin-associated ferredoxin
MYVCICNAVSDSQLREVVLKGAESLPDVQRHLPVANCCGMCEETAKETIESVKQTCRFSAVA